MKITCTIFFLMIFGMTHAQEISTFILVRHAEKVVSENRDPELSETGKIRAEKLNNILESVQINAIYTTDFIRTKSTVRPIAESKNITPRIYNPSELNAFGDLIVKRHSGETVLVSGHSNTTPALLNVLTGSEEYESLDESEYDWVYIVDLIGIGNTKVKALKVPVE